MACEINTCDELVTTELMFNGVFNDLKPEQVSSGDFGLWCRAECLTAAVLHRCLASDRVVARLHVLRGEEEGGGGESAGGHGGAFQVRQRVSRITSGSWCSAWLKIDAFCMSTAS